MIGTTNAKIGDKVNGIIKEYVVNTGENIAKGDFVSLLTTLPTSGSVVNTGAGTVDDAYEQWSIALALSDSKFVIIYPSGSTSGLYCKIGNVSGTTITYTNPTYIETNAKCSHITGCVVDTNKIYLCFNRNSQLYNIVLTINANDTISVGTLALMENFNLYNPRISLIETNKALICWANGASKFFSVVTISGTTMSHSTLVSFSSSTNSTLFEFDLCYLDTNKFIILYKGSSNYLYGRIITISGTTVTINTEYLINNSYTEFYPTGITTSQTTLFAIYTININGGFLRYKKITVSGTTISSDTETNLSTEFQTVTPRVIRLSDSQCYAYTQNSTARKGAVIDIGENTLALNKVASGSGGIYYPYYCKLSSEKLARIYNVSVSYTSSATSIVSIPSDKIKSYDTTIAGVAKTGGTAGETIKVFMPE